MDQSTLSIVLKAVDLASADIEAVRAQVTKLGTTSTETAAKTDAAAAATTRQGNAMKGLMVGAGVAAAAIGVVGGVSVKMAGDFEASMTRLSTSAGESQSNLKMVSDGVLKIAQDTGTSTEQLSSGMYTVESAGYHASEALTILKAAAQGAKTENADLGKVTDAVTSAMRDYNLPASQAADVTSKMVAAVGQGKSTFEDFTGSLHSVLPLASALHVPLNDILGDLAAMTVHGMSADQATQNLAEAIRKMQSPTTQMTAELSQLGINSNQLSDDLSKKGLSGTLEEISSAIFDKLGPAGKVMLDAFNGNKVMAADALKMMSAMPKSLQDIAEAYKKGSMSQAEFRTALKALPTDQANLLSQFVALNSKATGFSDILKSGKNTAQDYGQALAAATGDATTMNVALMLTGENASYTKNAINAVSKAHAEAKGNVMGWSEVQSTFNVQLAQFREALQTSGIAIGTALLPAAKALFGVINDTLKPIAEFSAGHKTAAAAIFLVSGALLVGIAGFLGMIKVVKDLRMGIEDIQGAFVVLAEKNIPGAIASMAKAATAWVISTAKMAAESVATAAKATAAWVASGAKATASATTMAAQTVAAYIKVAAAAAANAAKSTAAWVVAAARSEDGLTISIVKLIARYVALGAAAVFNATVALGAWTMAAVRTAAVWAANLPIVIGRFVLVSGAAIIQSVVTLGAWTMAAVKSAAIWAFQSTVIIGKFVLMGLAAITQGTIMVGQFTLAAVRAVVLGAAIEGVKIATGLWTAAQWLLNIALDANPIGLIIAGIAALIGFIALIVTHMNIFKAAIADVWGWIMKWGDAFLVLLGPIGAVIGAVSHLGDIMNAIKGAGTNVGSALHAAHIPGFASGVSNFSGGLAMVGEKGPELVSLPTGSSVMPAQQTAQALQGGGETHYHLNVNVGTYAGQPGELNNLASSIWKALAQVARRNGQAGNLPNLGINIQ